MLSLRLGGLTVALLAVLGASSAAQVSIDMISPSVGTTGDIIRIDGSGFGTKKPKALFVDENLKKVKKTSLKVVSITDTVIEIEVRKAVVGLQDLQLKFKGKNAPAPVSADAFEVMAPQISADSFEADPKAEVTIGVNFLGNKKPKIKINGKKAKVKAWGPNPEEGDGATGFVTFVTPKSLANGTWPLELLTKVGVDAEPLLAKIINSTKKIGKVSFKAVVAGQALNAKGKKLVITNAANLRIVIAAAAIKGGKTRMLNINFPYTDGVTPLPVTISGSDLLALPLMTYSEGSFQGGAAQVANWGGTNWSVTLNAASAGQLSGTFEGTLTPQFGATGTKAVTGNFIADID